MIPVKEIRITRVEGKTDGIEKRFNNWDDAHIYLIRQGYSAPEKGNGYDKCDFMVEWQDGETYTGRFDLQKGGVNSGGDNLKQQVKNMLLFWANKRRPLWTLKKGEEKNWEDMQRQNINEGYQKMAEEFLKAYEV